MGIWVVFIVLIVICCLLAFIKPTSSTATTNQNKNFESDYYEIKRENKLLREDYSKCLNDISELRQEIENLLCANNSQALIIRDWEQKHLSMGDLERRINDTQVMLNNRQQELELISNNAATIAVDEGKKLLKLAELEASMKGLEGRISGAQQQLSNIENEINITNKDLEDRKILHRAVINIESNQKTVWDLTPGEVGYRLISMINEIIINYPELKMDLSKIVWSKVWLPLLQELCGREGLDKRGGIYKITLKRDENICYIGQTTNFKERWYTHVKKMVGAEAKGMEKLYQHRPDEVTWEVVEFKEGNLDNDEKYWIDYYKCREIGLNKKR